MVRIAVIASLVCLLSCAQKSGGDDSELSKMREDIAEVHKDLRDLRDEQRSLRAELRELRENGDPKLAQTDPPDGGGDTPAPEATTDAGPADTKSPPIKSQPAKQENVRISISSNPSRAKVYIKGKVVGRTPVLLQRVPGPDTIDIRVEKEGYRPRILTVRPEEDTKLDVQLAKK